MTQSALVSLSDLVTALESGGRPKGGVSETTGEIFSIGGEHLNDDGGFDFSNKRFVQRDFFEQMKRGMVRQSDILIVKDGATTGKVSFVDADFPYEPCCINEHVFRVAIDPSQAEAKYVFYYLYSPYGNRKILSDFRGSTVGGISQEFTEKVNLPLPPLPEQRRIAALLDKVDKLRRTRRYAAQLSETFLQSVFVRIFGDPRMNPRGWDVMALEEAIVDTKNGFGRREDFSKSGVIVLRIREVGAGFIDYSEPRRIKMSQGEIADYQLENGDILLVRVNGNPDLVGRAALFQTIGEPVAFNDHIIRVRINRAVVNPVFLVHLLNNEYGRKQVRGAVTTTAGQFTINHSGLAKIVLAFPPLAFQEKFERVVQQFEHLRAQQREAERQAEHLFQTLLHRAFSGELG